MGYVLKMLKKDNSTQQDGGRLWLKRKISPKRMFSSNYGSGVPE
jgi:hypothetical protein